MSDKPFTDDSLMPFGIHEDKKLANVPARYLLHLYEMDGGIKHQKLRDYVDRNIDTLRFEAEKESYLDK